ncbi:MAG: glycoside hydrolase family 43 protein [Acidobacteriaceae bacterium]
MVRNGFRTLLLVVLAGLCAHAQTPATFHNPLLPIGPDPWVILHDGFYYYMNSTQTNLTIWKTRDIADLAHAQKRVVWTPPATGPYSREVWAPELHRLDAKWYLYFAADNGSNAHHRIWVIENDAADPVEGTWTFKGKVADPSDKWAIDPTVFALGGKDYIVWSGWEGDTDGVQSLYIARLKNPWTIEGRRVRLSTPQYPWEKVGDFAWDGKVLPVPHVDVNEGPEILQHGGRTSWSIRRAAAGPTTTSWACSACGRAATRWIRRRGRNPITPSSGRIPPDTPTAPGTTGSSCRRMVGRTGSSITPIPGPMRAAAASARRVSSPSHGTPMRPRISGARSRWGSRWKSPPEHRSNASAACGTPEQGIAYLTV